MARRLLPLLQMAEHLGQGHEVAERSGEHEKVEHAVRVALLVERVEGRPADIHHPGAASKD